MYSTTDVYLYSHRVGTLCIFLFVSFSVIFVIKSVDFYTNAIYLYLSDSKRRRKSFLSMLHSVSEQERMYQEANDFS